MSPTKPDAPQIKDFWEAHPLFAFESPFGIGTQEFFAWHDRVRVSDVEMFSYALYEFNRHRGERVLDVGCGIGWLCKHWAQNGANIVGVDLTRRGVELTRQRLDFDSLTCTLAQASAEQLPFAGNTFDFVTCAGVLHHTPDTAGGIREIWRVLKPGGRALISLYYRNWVLTDPFWFITRLFVRALFRRVPGRDAFGKIDSVNDLVRVYDGNANPLGKAYTRSEFAAMLAGFKLEHMEPHYFPSRFLPAGKRLPRWLHAWLDQNLGLMVYATVCKCG